MGQIVKVTYTVTVLAQQEDFADYQDALDSLANIEYAISEGPMIGDFTQTGYEVLNDSVVHDELVAIGNDGSYFDSVYDFWEEED